MHPHVWFTLQEQVTKYVSVVWKRKETGAITKAFSLSDR